MKGYKKGEIWLKFGTGEEVMLVRTVDNYVYCHDKKRQSHKADVIRKIFGYLCTKIPSQDCHKPRLLAWDAAIGELLTAAIVMLCISLLVMANVALFRFLAG